MFLALDIQHAMRMRHIFISGPLWLCHNLPNFLVNGTFFGKNVIDHVLIVLIVILEPRATQTYVRFSRSQSDLALNSKKCTT